VKSVPVFNVTYALRYPRTFDAFNVHRVHGASETFYASDAGIGTFRERFKGREKLVLLSRESNRKFSRKVRILWEEER